MPPGKSPGDLPGSAPGTPPGSGIPHKDTTEHHAAVEAVVRDSYGRLVAFLASCAGDVALAEDALGDALLQAMRTWPVQGVPAQPQAWLLTVAKRRLIDTRRHHRVERAATAELAALLDRAAPSPDEAHVMDEGIPDERLKLLFVCAHPAIDLAARAPLMLQTVFGFDAQAIAGPFLVSPASMSQRLVRAKKRIRDAAVPFAEPAESEWAERVDAVLDAIYAVYGRAWDALPGSDPDTHALAAEAVRLARLIVKLMPDEPEPCGLLSLLLHCEARSSARRNAAGQYVPLDMQDVALWNRPMIAEAEACLHRAAKQRKIGRFQLMAAIGSAHARRAFDGVVPWEEIVTFYDALLAMTGAVGAHVGKAAALAHAGRVSDALACLDEISEQSVRDYQPYWATRAHTLAGLGLADESRRAYERAIGLCADPATRAFLAQRLARLRDE